MDNLTVLFGLCENHFAFRLHFIHGQPIFCRWHLPSSSRSILFLCPSCWNLPRWCRFGSGEGIEQGRPRPLGEGSGRTAGCPWSRAHSAAVSTGSASGQAKPQPGLPRQGKKLPGARCRQEPFPQPTHWHICPPEKHFCFSQREETKQKARQPFSERP